jgi:alpha-glucosidase
MTAQMPRDEPGRLWWRDGVGYQIYPRSFADSNGDGVGDLEGIIRHLDHVQWLGVDFVWISPTFSSPNKDWGYDVSDYTGIHSELGDLATMDLLLEEAAARNLRVLLDLVPNHTSDRHPWFLESRSSRDNPKRDYYVWADPLPDGSPPNNWLSDFATGPAWSLDETTGQMYLHHFLPEQPDLNWWSGDVQAEFERILRFWFDRGVAGWRIDVAHRIVKDRQLRDNPPARPDDHWFSRLFSQRFVYNQNRPEVHELMRQWRAIAESYDPPRMLVGETHVFDFDVLAEFYGRGDELNLAFNFMLPFTPFRAPDLAAVVEKTEATFPVDAWPAWPLGNHDEHRYVTRWCEGDRRRIGVALMLVLCLRGTPFLYYGDEIGMPDTEIPPDRLLDPVGILLDPSFGRDPERTPMHWTGERGGGFSDTGVEPWLPYGDAAACNVADQRDDPRSPLHLTRDLIALRRATLDLHRGGYRTERLDGDLWAWRRGERTVVAVNLGGDRVALPLHGRVLLGTDRERDGQDVSGELVLGPWEGAIVDTFGHFRAP